MDGYLSRISCQGGVSWSSEAAIADVGVVRLELGDDAEQLASGQVHQEPDGQGDRCHGNQQLEMYSISGQF